jgi:hypothetical protein
MDLIQGGSGDDTFIFATGSGHDYIYDFLPGTRGLAGPLYDELDLRNTTYNFQSAQDVLDRTTTSILGHAVINLGGGDYVTLVNVTKAQLTHADFIV